MLRHILTMEIKLQKWVENKTERDKKKPSHKNCIRKMWKTKRTKTKNHTFFSAFLVIFMWIFITLLNSIKLQLFEKVIHSQKAAATIHTHRSNKENDRETANRKQNARTKWMKSKKKRRKNRNDK